MNRYSHHIGDFNNSTRHLTRVERSVYRDAIERYYDTEQPLTADLDALARRLLCVTDEEKNALLTVLSEFFTTTDDGYVHDRCEEEIEKYRTNSTAKAKAGKASAEARRRKRTERKHKLTSVQHASTDVEQNPTNLKPLTVNHKPYSSPQINFSEEDESCAKWIFEKILNIQPERREPNIKSWAKTVRLMRERDSRTHRDICELFLWANNDPFWQTNILSPSKLREKWDDLQLKRRSSSNGKTNRQTQTTAYDRTMSAINEWERKQQSQRIVDGEVVEVDD